jgi:hypothetical protein
MEVVMIDKRLRRFALHVGKTLGVMLDLRNQAGRLGQEGTLLARVLRTSHTPLPDPPPWSRQSRATAWNLAVAAAIC